LNRPSSTGKVLFVLSMVLYQFAFVSSASATADDLEFVVPDESLCNVTPYSVSELRTHLVEIGVPKQFQRRPRLQAIPVAFETNDLDVLDGTAEFLMAVIACDNKGVLFSSRLYSDNNLLLAYPTSSLEEFDEWSSQFDGIDQPAESHGSKLAIGGIFGTTVFEDDRIGTFALIADAPTVSPILSSHFAIAYYVFVSSGDSYLVDEEFGVGEVRPPTTE
jgi:hypothetical protein